MKKFYSVLTVFLSLFFMSCATAISIPALPEEYKVIKTAEEPVMDFIGYKIDTNILSTSSSAKTSVGVWTNNVFTTLSEFDQAKAISQNGALRQLGNALEKNNIAKNKADTYFGIYSLQEMELYKTDKRYVTFVEVVGNKFDYHDNRGSKNVWGGIGTGCIAGGLIDIMVGNSMSDDEIMKDAVDAYKGVGTCFTIGGLICLVPALTPSKTEITFNGLYNIYLYDTKEKKLVGKETDMLCLLSI